MSSWCRSAFSGRLSGCTLDEPLATTLRTAPRDTRTAFAIARVPCPASRSLRIVALVSSSSMLDLLFEALEATRQLLDRQLETLAQLAQQPRLLERAVDLGAVHQPAEQQGLLFGQVPARGADRVVAKLEQRTDPLVAIDQDVAAVAAPGDDHHR